MNTLWTGSSSSPLPRHEPGDNEEVAAHLIAPCHDNNIIMTLNNLTLRHQLPQ